MKIEILYFEGCPNHEVAHKRVREVLEELGIRVEILHVNVEDDETAQAMRFPGSPTVRVNDEDVAPGSNGESYSMRCRVYPTTSGFEGAPDKNAIRTAIERSTA